MNNQKLLDLAVASGMVYRSESPSVAYCAPYVAESDMTTEVVAYGGAVCDGILNEVAEALERSKSGDARADAVIQSCVDLVCQFPIPGPTFEGDAPAVPVGEAKLAGIEDIAQRAGVRILTALDRPPVEFVSVVQATVSDAIREYWPSVFRTPEQERERFEATAFQHYLERHAAGLTTDCNDPVGTREQLLWRQDNGDYGVLMFNASWWAWQEAVKGGA